MVVVVVVGEKKVKVLCHEGFQGTCGVTAVIFSDLSVHWRVM